MNARGLSVSAEWGTPRWIIEGVTAILGGWIDLDPASSAKHNEVVKALKFYTKEMEGLKLPWAGKVFLNAPGDKSGKLVQRFWEKLTVNFFNGNIQSAVWLGFNISQLRTCQDVGPVKSPLYFPTVIFKKRVKYLENGVERDQPTQDSYLTYLTRVRGAGMDRLMRYFGEYGHVGFFDSGSISR